MAIELTNEGERSWLARVFASVNVIHNHIKLFKSSFVPDEDSVLADFLAAECDFSGYSPQEPGGFGPVTTIGDQASIGVDCVTFWHDGGEAGNEVGGWFHDDEVGNVNGYEVFDPFVTMDTMGDEIIVCPRYCLSTGCTP